jgi:DNA-binding GntR family transcriptional regulator
MGTNTTGKPNQQPSARQETYRFLRERLLGGEYAPNERLVEESIARALGVSRTPVREALHKLELEGLVEPAGARGFRVPEDSVAEMKELFEIRGVMEGHALACLVDIVTARHLEDLNELIGLAERACEQGNLDSVFKLNTRFHDLLYGLLAAQRPRLFSLIEDMRDYVVRYRRNSLITKESALHSIAGHKKIVLALSLGDRHLCEQLMRSHVKEAQEDALKQCG